MSPGSASKRLVDVAASAIGLLLLAPVLAVIAVGVRLSSPGPAVHRAQRVGRDGVPFTLYKFRSMRVGAATSGPAVTAAGDERITRFGAVLRRTKLDELPQLWNVVRGDMSLVGPRPEDARFVAMYTGAQRRILRWRPGLTSPASLAYRDEERLLATGTGDIEERYRSLMGDKISLDLEYLDRATLRGDLRIVLHTLRDVVVRRDASAHVEADDRGMPLR